MRGGLFASDRMSRLVGRSGPSVIESRSMSDDDKTAWFHPNYSEFVVLPDGYQMHRTDALAKGFSVSAWPDSEKVVTEHPYDDDVAVAARGVVMHRDNARVRGFVIGERIVSDPTRAWRTAILTLPEAKGRPSAAAELAASQTPETMSVEQARAMLRGLPTEQEEKVETMPTANHDPRVTRLAEITDNARRFNRDRGYANRPSPAARHASASLATVEPAKLRRLAEIRLAALQVRGEQIESKKLRYALDVHSQTGSPLANVFAQLKVDTSKLIPNR